MSDTCKEVISRIYFYLDGEILTETERSEIGVHLEDCPPCMDCYELYKSFIISTHRLLPTTPCPDSLKARITSLLDQA